MGCHSVFLTIAISWLYPSGATAGDQRARAAGTAMGNSQTKWRFQWDFFQGKFMGKSWDNSL